MREMLRKMTPVEIAGLPEHDLERAVVNAMAERAASKVGGMANRFTLPSEVIHRLAMDSPNMPYHERKPLEEQIERNFRNVLQSLESARLIEPASGPNGANGFIVLTPEGVKAAQNPLDLETIRIRLSTPE